MSGSRIKPPLQFNKFSGFEYNGSERGLTVEWYPNQFSRDTFPPDLIFSFGSLLTISNISRNNAESRILKIIDKKTSNISTNVLPADSESENESLDFEVMAGDEISRYIIQRFQGHGLTRLVEAILKAQGYTTYLSPEGSDGGGDIIAGYGHLGFGTPRLVVQVKSGDSPTDRPTVDNLMGVVQRFKANEGLFVSWSGFKKNVYREMASDFFTIRLWTQKEFLEALFQNYDKLDEDLKAEIPLKRIWALTQIEN